MEKVDFAKVVPIYYREKNVVVNRRGDITFCFRYKGSELCGASEFELDKMNSDFGEALGFFSDRVVLHKQDIYLEKKFYVGREGSSFLTNSYFGLYDNATYLSEATYLFISKTRALRTEVDYQEERLYTASKGALDSAMRDRITAFENECLGFITFMRTCGMQLQEMTEDEVDDTVVGWFSLYDNDFTMDINFKEKEIGFNRFEMVSINSGELLPSTVKGCMLDPEYRRYSERIVDIKGDRVVGLYSGFFNTLGYAYKHPHIVNQVLFLDGKHYWRSELEKRRKEFTTWSLFSPENAVKLKNITEFENDTLDKNELVVRYHFNILFWDDKAKMPQAIENVRSKMKELGVIGHVVSREEIRHLFLSSCPGNMATLPEPETIIGHASSMTALVNKQSVTTGFDPSKKGLVFTDRNSNTLVKRDAFHDVYQKGINNRNWICAGKSGSGKSSLSIEIARQYFEMGFNCTILDIGRSFEVLAKSHGGNYIIYEDGVELGVNPFQFKGREASVEDLEFLSAFTATLWKPNEVFTDSQTDALENVLKEFYGMVRKDKTGADDTGFLLGGDFSNTEIKDFYHWVEKNQGRVGELTKNNKAYFDTDSFLLSIEKFVNGKYDRLLLGGTKLDTTKRITVWELDNIKDHPILFPIVSMLIIYITTNVIWKQVAVEKIVILEEAWKFLGKPSMVSYIKWLYKTIRKFDGGVALNIQNMMEIAEVPEIKQAILSNTDVKYIMSHAVPDAKELANLLDWDDHKLATLLSIPLDSKKVIAGKRFSEFVSVVGNDVKAYRLMVSKEQVVNFMSEMSEKVKLFELVKQTHGDWQLATKQYVAKYMS